MGAIRDLVADILGVSSDAATFIICVSFDTCNISYEKIIFWSSYSRPSNF